MKNVVAVAALLFAVAAPAGAQKTKCEASINGYKIKTVYVTGNQFNGVAWAYKHIGEVTCLTPTVDASKADAILEVIPNAGSAKSDTSSLPDSISVSCSSSGASSSCVDSNGYEMDISCDKSGNCASYYGPSAGAALVDALASWVGNVWYQSEAVLYTPDHKILWKSKGLKGEHWFDYWPDKLRESTFDPKCKVDILFAQSGFRKMASKKCGVEFDSLVSIDIKANTRITQKNGTIAAKQAEADEMKRNAEEAAAARAKN